MARQVLDNGIVLPSEYSDDWYDDMTSNLTKLDEVIGSNAEKLSASDVGDAAISNDYDDLDDKPAYNILRRASVTLTAGGTGNYSDLDSASKIKAGDYVLDAANKLYSITAIDAANSTYTVSAAALFTVTDKAELGAAALSNDYDDLNNLPGYGILRFCSTAITDNSNVAFANISSVSKIAAGDFLLDTAGKLYQIASIDTANNTAAVTTPIRQLALDANVMHLSGNETASGEKTFNNIVPINGVYVGDEPSASFRTVLLLRSIYDTAGKSGWLVSKFRSNSAQGALSGSDTVFLNFDVLENEVRTNGILRFNLSSWSGNTPGRFSLIPSASIESYIGSTGNKWLGINGLNPGALSLPNLNNGLDISGYITVTANANKESLYTPPVNGWVCVRLSRTSGALGVLLIQGGMASSGKNIEVESGVTTADAMLPVVGGVQVSINSALADGVVSAYFYPCLGNV